MDKIKVFIVDDHVAYRKGIRLLLDSIKGVEIVGEAINGKDFLNQLTTIDIDIVLMDIKMPDMNGVEATKSALEFNPNLKIIVLSMFEEPFYINKMLNLGVKGYLSKNVDSIELINAIKSVRSNELFFSKTIESVMKEIFVTSSLKLNLPGIYNAEPLTPRELQILYYICEGHTNVEIGEILNISPRTAQGHRNRLLHKTNSQNTASLINYAYKNKLISISN